MPRPLFRKLLKLQPGEGRRTALMFGYIFLLIATLLVIKPVRNSIFLTHVGVEMLPYAFLLVAVVSGGFVAAYTRISNKIRLNQLILYTMGGSVGAIILFWMAFQLKISANWFYYMFYVWVAIFGVLVTTQFWLLANYVFDVREAKRLFGILGAGGIAGGIFGGYFTNLLAPVAGSEDLLLFGALFLIGCMVIVQFVWQRGAEESYREQTQRRRKKHSAESDRGNPLQIIFRSRYLTLLASLIGIGVIIANLVDYQYSAIATSIISDEDKLTAFFGFWLSTLSVFSLMIQLLLTPPMLRRFGVGGSLHFLPAGVFAGSVMVLLSGGLASAVMIKLFEGGFKQSIHKSGLELLWLPISTSVKNRVKAFIDVFVDNIATGTGGLLLIALTGFLGWDIAGISFVILALVVIWVVLNVIIRGEYVQAFRSAIEKRSIRLDQQVVNASDPALLDTVLSALDSGNSKQVIYALDLVEQVRHVEISKRFESVLDQHDSREIVCRILDMATNYEATDISELAQTYLGNRDAEIRVCAINYLVDRSDEPTAVLADCLASEDPLRKMAALRVTADLRRHDKTIRSNIDFQHQFEELLRAFEDQTADSEPDTAQMNSMRIELSDVLGRVNLPELYPYLHMLLADDSVEVLRAAVSAAGDTQSDEFLPTLTAHLTTKYVRKTAREALANYGDEILKPLAERLNDEREDLRIRMSIPPVFAKIGTQAAARALQENINQSNTLLRHACIKGLNKLRSDYRDLKMDRSSVETNLLEEAATYYLMLEILQFHMNGGTPSGVEDDRNRYQQARKLLIRALEERLERNFEVIFRLLGLRYVPEDMYNAYRQVTGSKMDLRANAIELLDNVLDQKLKRVLLPLVETPSIELKLERGRELFGQDPLNAHLCLESLLEGDDTWLKVCTLYYIGESGKNDFISLVNPYTDASDGMVRETAHLAISRLRSESADLNA
jgi:ATP:ADP antiporter, AAA family